MTLNDKKILLIISGGIAAYKALELIRLIRKDGGEVRCVLTSGGEKFVTRLSVSALSEHEVYTDLWAPEDESGMAHIRLSREADLILVAPASANLIAKMAHGLADDLASTLLLAADKPTFLAPAMNHKMWDNPATRDNLELLVQRGHILIPPTEGDMACGEFGTGRLAEPADILSVLQSAFKKKPLHGLNALVTSGPTYEPLDPVRFIGNRSSGKQGHAIAEALRDLGADVTLVSGPTALPDPPGLKTLRVETAAEMLTACETSLPCDIAVCAAAVADWRPEKQAGQKMKKRGGGSPPALHLIENPDILATLSAHHQRPRLVIGFAAETTSLRDSAREKLLRKGCDWIVANEVGKTGTPVFGADENRVILMTSSTQEEWPSMSKKLVAARLASAIAETFAKEEHHGSKRNRPAKSQRQSGRHSA